MKRWGITKRLMALALIPGAVIGLALYSYFVNSQLHMIELSLHERGMTMARQLAPASEYGVATGNTEILERLIRSVLNQRDVLGIELTDKEGKTILHLGQGQHSPMENHYSHMAPALFDDDTKVALCSDEHNRLIFCAPIQLTRIQVSDFPETSPAPVDNPVLGYVHVEISKADTFAKRTQLISNAVAITIVVLFITGLIAAYVGYRISRPIVAMTTIVREVGKGNLDLKLHPAGAGEIGALSHGINAMIASLRVARDELRSQVDAATFELRRTLQELEEKNIVLEEQRLKAQAASQAKGQFLANMSHEIRTPLSGIIGMLDLLTKTEMQPLQQAYVVNLSLAANALHGLLNDILDLSRIEAGKLQLTEQWFNPHEVLTEVTMMLAPSAHEKSLDLICHPLPGFPDRAFGDSLRLRQVLINLIANAIKFTDTGRIVVRAIPLGAVQDDQLRVRFEVEDTGIGIPADRQQQVFDSFTQIDTSNTRKHGGSGLGTTISRELVQLMGGEIGLRSEEGGGSQFWFEIPWQVEEAASASAMTAALQGKGLLIVDRCAEERAALADIARSLGLTVAEAADEAGARAVLADSANMILMLLVESTPQGSWLPLGRDLHQHGTVRLCHVTFLNGQTDFGLFDAYLNKPVMAEALRETLLDMQRSAEEMTPVSTAAATGVAWRVLVAEDNHINALVIKSFLELAGHQVLCVDNGAEAITALQQEPFDIVFMDMRMPQMDGLEATRRWRAQEETDAHLPIIALTANATVEDREQCLAAGMDDFLAKPISQDQLLETIQNLQCKAIQ